MSKARQLADLGNQVDDGAITGSNMVTNGAMNVAQRGDGTGLTASGYHGPDRFKFNQSGRDQFQVSVSQDSDGPDGYSNSWKLQTTTAETAIDSTEYVMCQHRIEAQNLQHLSYGNSNAKQVTLSFWVKSSIAATYSVYLYAADGVEIIGSTYTINTASTWEYKTVTFAGNTSSAINHDNGAGVDIGFILAAGSGMRTTSNTSWSAYAGDTNPSNLGIGGSTSDTWQITGVCLNVGDSAIDFPHESYGDTLARCQRYYYRRTSVGSNGNYYRYLTGFYTATSTCEGVLEMPVEMRATPSLTSAGLFASWDSTSVRPATSVAIGGDGSSKQTITLNISGISGGTALRPAQILSSNNSSSYIELDAEL